LPSCPEVNLQPPQNSIWPYGQQKSRYQLQKSTIFFERGKGTFKKNDLTLRPEKIIP
jgi:hypothetical protein